MEKDVYTCIDEVSEIFDYVISHLSAKNADHFISCVKKIVADAE